MLDKECEENADRTSLVPLVPTYSTGITYHNTITSTPEEHLEHLELALT